MQYKNIELLEMRNSLKPILSKRNVIGYIAARNVRIISNTIEEYEEIRNDAVNKYGEKDPNTNIIFLKPDSPNFKQFVEEMKPYDEIIQDINIMKGKYQDIIGELSGTEILQIDWMLED